MKNILVQFQKLKKQIEWQILKHHSKKDTLK